MKSSKGFQLGIRAVTLIVIILIVLTTLTAFFLEAFKAPSQSSQNITEGARDEALGLGLGSKLKSLATGGSCKGEITSGEEVCGYYYDPDYGSGGTATVEVSSCGMVKGKTNRSNGQCLNESNNPDGICLHSCSDLDEVGKEFCEARGCTWASS